VCAAFYAIPMSHEPRSQALREAGAAGPEVEELLAYNRTHFDLSPLEGALSLPLADEPFVAFWSGRAAAAREAGFAAALAPHLPQLAFPVRDGISQTEGYRDATRRGRPPAEIAEATGLGLPEPGAIEIVLHPTAVGRIPLLIVRHRATFVALLQALARRNEPVPVPDSHGARMVAGYNNWSRLGALERRWQETPAAERTAASWTEELAGIKENRRELFQDRFILLSDGPYSGVPAAELGLAERDWRERSLALRREHECAHYVTRRLLGSMRNNARDELIADCAGIRAAAGSFRADWFLRFLGLEEFPRYRPGGRLELYRGDPPLSDGAFRALQALLVRAATNLERFDHGRQSAADPLHDAFLLTAALASCHLEEIAADGGPAALAAAWARAAGNVTWTEPAGAPAP
jgi:hypothetical protein